MRSFKYIAPFAVLLLAGCQQGGGPKYYWGDYQTSLYDYYANPTAEPNYEKALGDVTLADAKGKKTPPGLFAEYGYIALSHGDTDKAIQLFQREKQAWPESSAFMDKAIDNARNSKKPVASGATPAVPAAASPATPVS